MSNIPAVRNILQNEEIDFDSPATADNLGRISETTNFHTFYQHGYAEFNYVGNFGSFGTNFPSTTGYHFLPWQATIYGVYFSLGSVPVGVGNICSFQLLKQDLPGGSQTQVLSTVPTVFDTATGPASAGYRISPEDGSIFTFESGAGINNCVINPANNNTNAGQQLSVDVNVDDSFCSDLFIKVFYYWREQT